MPWLLLALLELKDSAGEVQCDGVGDNVRQIWTSKYQLQAARFSLYAAFIKCFQHLPPGSLLYQIDSSAS